MRQHRTITTLAGLILASQLLAIAGRAQTPAVSFADTTSNVGNVNNLTRGYTFHVNQSFAITALGFFDSDQDGLFDSHTVTLWNLGQTPLASVTVPAGTSAPLIDNFRFVSITPLVLNAGQNYTVGAYYPNSSQSGGDHMIINASSLVTNPELTIEFYNLAHPGYFDPYGELADQQSFGANFLIAPVPEPSTTALLGLGAAAAFAVRRRSKRLV